MKSLACNVVFVLILLAGCASPVPEKLVDDKEHVKQDDSTIAIHSRTEFGQATVQYLGVGGMAFSLGGQRLLTAPFYTDPKVWRLIPFIPMGPNEDCINRMFPVSLHDKGSAEDVQAVLVGHSHYDHLLDVPHLLENYVKTARVLGSASTRNLVNLAMDMTCRSDERVDVIDGRSFYDYGENIRVYPVHSTHAPHFGNITAMTGAYSCSDGKPGTAWDWKMGEVYAYVIDYLNDNKETVFRIFYQDSASEKETLHLPDYLPAKKIDVAVLVMAGFSKVKNYPDSIIRETDASLYLIGHWDDFFGGCSVKQPLVTRGTDANEFVHALEKALVKNGNTAAQWRMLYPSKSITITAENL